jgi:hypothetical protein
MRYTNVQTAGSGKKITLRVPRRLLKVLFMLKDVENPYVNAGMQEKS